MAPSAFKAMLRAEQPVKAERGSESSLYEVAWQASKPIEGRCASSAAKNTASTLLWRIGAAHDRHMAILRVPKTLRGASACVSVTMRQAQALQAIMQQAGKRQSGLAPMTCLWQGRTSVHYPVRGPFISIIMRSLSSDQTWGKGFELEWIACRQLPTGLRSLLMCEGGSVKLATHSSSGIACCPAVPSRVDTSGGSSAMLRVAVTESPSWTSSVIIHSLLSCSTPRALTLPSDLSSSTHGNTLQVSR